MATERESTNPAPLWSPARRILFRFGFVYLTLYILPFPLNILPDVAEPYTALWNTIVPRVGRHVFQVEVFVSPTGSGDTTYHYVQGFCFLILATATAAVWTLLDRGRPSYSRLSEWLKVYVRFYLATTMISYAAFKIIPTQFRSPSLDRLVQPLGESSPMGLLWTFMGASASYTIFTGVSELLGGLLLTTRRTTLLGALVCLAVLSNVVVLNFSYDVPVKLLSCHLLAMAMFLAAPDLRRLGRLFLLNRPVDAVEFPSLFRRKWLQRSALVLRTVFVVGFIAGMLYQVHAIRKSIDRAQNSSLYGIWSVEEFEHDGERGPPLVTDRDRWRRVIFDVFPPSLNMGLAIQPGDKPLRRFVMNHDAEAHSLDLTKRNDPQWKATFSYQQSEPDSLLLEGTIDGRNIRAELQRADASDFLLVHRGFHWINEFPFLR